jgi:hypothetical protein
LSSVAEENPESSSSEVVAAVERVPTAEEQGLVRENAFPVYAPRRGTGKPTYALVPGRKGEMLSNYALFLDSIRKAELPWLTYDAMTRDEKAIYMAHIKALEVRKLEYVDPHDKRTKHKTVSPLIFAGECCGEGCRHCPYKLENCSPEIRKHLVYNGAYYL